MLTLTVDQKLPANTDFRELFVNRFVHNGNLDLNADAEVTDFGPTTELGPLRDIQFLEIGPPEPGVPSVSVIDEQLPNGKFKYTLNSNYVFTVDVTDEPL